LRGLMGDCTIKLAYQAAEANHPYGAEKARR
jgi:divalent metal cation (Fe/Co/Zn/Cd) transporter